MKKKLLLTGITGFIGRNVARKIISDELYHEYECYAIVRSSSQVESLKEFSKYFSFLECDLSDISSLNGILDSNTYDVILHIAAIRGTQKYSHYKYRQTNIETTRAFASYSLNHNSKLIFCSSVGVFGAFPKSPVTKFSPYNPDSYYHATKIESEKILKKYIERGLDCTVFRPGIVYGSEDFGFFYKLISLINKNLLVLPLKNKMIHLTNINLISSAFIHVIQHSFSRNFYIVMDSKAVSIQHLAKKAGNILDKKYSYLILPDSFFKISFLLLSLIGFKNIAAQLASISKDWYYDVSEFYEDFKFPEYNTLELIDPTVLWAKDFFKLK